MGLGLRIRNWQCTSLKEAASVTSVFYIAAVLKARGTITVQMSEWREKIKTVLLLDLLQEFPAGSVEWIMRQKGLSRRESGKSISKEEIEALEISQILEL